MKSLDSIAAAFCHSFYKKEWIGNNAAIRRLRVAEAYEVQDEVTKKRIEKGERVVGYKVGCTSTAIREQFGINEPINGRLFQPHILDSKTIIDYSKYVNCAIEPEMVFKIGKDLKGIELSDEELINSIAYVSPGIELHNFKFWVEPPTIQELICSGGIHAGLIVGEQKVDPRKLLFKDEVFSVYKDGNLVTSAPSSEIMGGPIHSLRWLVTFLTKQGKTLKKDSLVIPGSPVELVNIDRDTTLKIEIDKVGSLTTRMEKLDI
jgi:2-keto-4-pentenoate hydratase|tara:strand:- start:182 stop:967 length:786 start_codon:yes stop_codon:yes gene_type:complete